MNDVTETLTFIVHAIKQFCFGFEKLDETADDYGDGSAAKAFYLTAIYHHLAAFYLLDKKPKHPMGGGFYKALKPYGLERCLDPVNAVLLSPLGSTTFGEVVRAFRNSAIVHPKYREADVGRVFRQVDMSDPQTVAEFQALLCEVYVQTKLLAINLIQATGLKLEDFGIREAPGEV
jgi:hypothetical protein